MNTASESLLWGKTGERWSANGRLPDFSWAGYHHGNMSPPKRPATANIRDYGAVGDGITDDTEAFFRAIGKGNDVIYVPPGRYVITNILEVTQSGTVLRGAGPEVSVLQFPISLSDIRPDWGATTGGQRTSNYSWSGGFVWLKGNIGNDVLTRVVSNSRRGQTILELDRADSIAPGQRIMIFQSDNSENSLAHHLYSDDAGEVSKLAGETKARLVCRCVAKDGNLIQLDRSLRFDIRSEWQPVIRAFTPSVEECGIEELGFEFPNNGYAGHFSELGRNAIALSNVCDCWLGNIRIQNADSGLFASGYFCTFRQITFNSVRPPDPFGNTGHHGVYIRGDDNLFTGFNFNTQFIHDITVSECAGNVFSNGKGVDLCFDHHKRAPYENLFTNIDAGKGSRLWNCGGGAALGKQCGARGTFWNIQTARSLSAPPASFAPSSINLVGLSIAQQAFNGDNPWLEYFPEKVCQPANIHQAQLKRRLQVAHGWLPKPGTPNDCA